MSKKFLVWRLCDGHSNASTFEAYGPEDAASRAHANDFEYDDEETFCVQAVTGDRKVCVMTVERKMAPEYSPTRLDAEWLKARCACGTRLFDNDGYRGKCRPCFIREQFAQLDARQKERAQ